MEYKKPQLILIGNAAEMIESSLSKTGAPPDSTLGSAFPTTAAAYMADE